ncbi:MAG: hypothetical protein HQ541_17980 [Mariniphaga sp.]|nr:hypothetical protein [Mariniphaga sp.]
MRELLKVAFIAGCQSRNEEYRTTSYEDAFNEWYGEDIKCKATPLYESGFLKDEITKP